jgi:hypothetical protein
MAPLSYIQIFVFILCLVGNILSVSSDEELHADIDKLQDLVSLLAANNVKLHGKINNVSSQLEKFTLDRKDLPKERFLGPRGKHTLLNVDNQRIPGVAIRFCVLNLTKAYVFQPAMSPKYSMLPVSNRNANVFK